MHWSTVRWPDELLAQNEHLLSFTRAPWWPGWSGLKWRKIPFQVKKKKNTDKGETKNAATWQATGEIDFPFSTGFHISQWLKTWLNIFLMKHCYLSHRVPVLYYQTKVWGGGGRRGRKIRSAFWTNQCFGSRFSPDPDQTESWSGSAKNPDPIRKIPDQDPWKKRPKSWRESRKKCYTFSYLAL